MNVLTDGDVEVHGYVFGRNYDLFVTDLDVVGDVRDQDQINPVGETRLFGRDRETPPTWTLEVVTNTENAALGLSALAQAKAVFRDEKIRSKPGATTTLRYNVAGRTRRIYGRPRKLYRKPGPVNDGVIEAVGLFEAADALYYDDVARSVSVHMVPPPTGGVTIPTTVPLIMGGLADVQGSITDVGGTEPTPFVAVIHGPITKPGLSGNGWQVKLTGSVTEGVDLIVDTRAGTVKDSLGRSRAGELTRFSRLQKARLRPGPDHVIFSGSDPTGQASADITWHPAYSEL